VCNESVIQLIFIIVQNFLFSLFQAREKVLLCLEMGLNALELKWMMNRKHLIGKDLINFYEMEIKCSVKYSIHRM
jgi:hypothetical protein